MSVKRVSRSLLTAVAAGAALMATFGAAASANRSEAVTATVSQPFAADSRVIAAGIVWNCSGDACIANAERIVNVRTCRRLAREVGPVTAFASATAALTAEQIEACNTAARPRA
jgi:hypothetical protein